MIRKKKEKIDSTNIRNERGDTSADLIDIRKIIREIINNLMPTNLNVM